MAASQASRGSLWSFDAGDTRGLEFDGRLRRSEPSGFFLSAQKIAIERSLPAPWTLSFKLSLPPYEKGLNNKRVSRISVIVLAQTNKQSFKLDGHHTGLQMSAGDNVVFHEEWDHREKAWRNWDIRCAVDGKVSIHVNEKKIFQYFLHHFEKGLPFRFVILGRYKRLLREPSPSPISIDDLSLKPVSVP